MLKLMIISTILESNDSTFFICQRYIELIEGSKLIKQKAYRISQIQFSTLNEKLKKLIEKRLIAPFHLPWSSPILLVF